MVTKLSCQRHHYAGHEWGIFGMLALMETLLVRNANKKIFAQNRYVDFVLHILCTLYRDELVAVNLMERLGLDLDMKMHLKAFQHKPGYTLHPDTLRNCMLSLCICPLLQKSLIDCKN